MTGVITLFLYRPNLFHVRLDLVRFDVYSWVLAHESS
jgi:hypothetical protein